MHIQTVQAYTTCTPGLVVTRRIGHKDWNLTHEGMGLAIITGTSKRAAYLFAGILGALCEWDNWDSTNHDERIEYSKKALQESGWYDWLRSAKNG